MDTQEIIEVLEKVRNHFLAAREFMDRGLPVTAATEEIAGVRLVNRAILELSASGKAEKVKSEKPKY